MELTKFHKFSLGVRYMLLQHMLNLLSGIFVGAMVARHYGPELFGAFSLSFFYVSVVSIIAGLGTSDLLPAEFIKKPSSREGLFWATFLFRITAYALCAILGFFVLKFLGVTDLVLKGYSLILIFGFTANINLFAAIAKSNQRNDKIAQIAIISLLVSIAYRVFIVISNKSIEHLYYNLIMITVVELLLMVCYLKKENMMYSFTAPNWMAAVKLLRKTLPMAVGGVAVAVGGNMALVLLDQLMTLESAGRYAVVFKLYCFVVFLSHVIHNNLFYYIESSGLTASEFIDRHLKVIIKTTAALSYLLVIGAFTILAPLLELLYGEQYEGVGIKFAVVTVSFVFAWATIPAQLKMLSEKRTGYLMGIDFLSLAINLGGAYILIKKYGEWGAYYLMPCTALLIMLANYYYSGLGRKIKRVFFWCLSPVPTKSALQDFTKH